MTDLFTYILNMSITASYVALAVIAIRIFLKKVPRIFSYVLWLPVLIRLVLPFTFNSGFSLFNLIKLNSLVHTGAMEYIPGNIGLMDNPIVDLGINGISNAINTSLPAAIPTASAKPMQIIVEMAGVVWIVGILLLSPR